ncbi:MAG: DUF3883 domain-containing protein [Rhodocyclaceae bacterium]|nr:DUF3883 domain-containing protein [Rhodocyclaceae bacterium]
MKTSSDKRLELWSKIETKQVQRLLSVLLQVTIHRTQFVRTAYCEQARNFEETLQFLQNINWVVVRLDEVSFCKDGEAACDALQNDQQLKQLLCQTLVSPESPYRGELADYFLQFSMNESILVYRPLLSRRLQQSAIRNFLMDLGAVIYRPSSDDYVLHENAVDLYIWAINFKRFKSKESFHSDVERKEQLGLAAEIAAFEYEQLRLGAQWSHKVEHIAAENPFACYDIKSVTLQNGGAIERYIEVKAVPPNSYQFYWTRSELEVSQLLGEKYFLYLLPVIASSVFDCKQILVIDNPYKNVYQSSKFWQVEENVIVCKKIQ